MNMGTKWTCTDTDCGQYIRNDGNTYEMVQYVWLDTTNEDKRSGLKEYCVVYSSVDIDDLYGEEAAIYVSMYGYTLAGLEKEFGVDCARDIVAECVLETDIINNGCILAELDTEVEAMEFIKMYIENN